MPLTDIAIRSAQPREKPYKMHDMLGLFLIVSPSGSKSWRMKYRQAGVEKKLSFGRYPEVSLRDARKRRDARVIRFMKGRTRHVCRSSESCDLNCWRKTPSPVSPKSIGGSCAKTGSRTASSSPTTISSITAALPGTGSSISHGGSSPSASGNGHMGSDQKDLVLQKP